MDHPTAGIEAAMAEAEDVTIDHEIRARRLTGLIENERSVREESIFEEPTGLGKGPIDLDGRTPHVPWRYAAPTYDGTDIWMEFADTLTAMKECLDDAVTGEIPYAPGEVVNLDTGEVWAPNVCITLERYEGKVTT